MLIGLGLGLTQARRAAAAGGGASVLPIGDTFAGTDATQLTSHTPTGSNPGASWTTVVGAASDLTLRNNELYRPTSASGLAIAVLNGSAAYGTNDYTAAAVFRFAGDPGGFLNVGVVARSGNTRSGYLWGFHNSGTPRWELIKLGAASDGSGDTLLGSTTVTTYAAMANSTPSFSLTVSGTTLTAKINGVTASFGAVTDATFATGLAGVAVESQAQNNINFGYYLDTLTVVTP